MFPMPGASLEHATITTNLIIELGSQFLDRPGSIHGPCLGVYISPTGSYVYPDVSIVLGDPALQDEHRDRLLNPRVIFEVLSPSTESYDRGPKFAHYRTMESLQEFVLISQTEPRIERFLRQEGAIWLYSEVADLEAPLELASVACRVPFPGSIERWISSEQSGGLKPLS
jgi:Uma2 family endonuclease